MKVLSCVAFLAVLVLAVKIRAQENECFDWKKELEELKEICTECKVNYTKKEDIQECFDDDDQNPDENGKFDEGKYLNECMDGFKGTDETKTKIESGVKKCLEKGAKDSKEEEKVEKCVEGVFKEHCKEAEEKFKEIQNCAGLKDCMDDD